MFLKITSYLSKGGLLCLAMVILSGCLYANTTFPLAWVSNTRYDVKDLTLEESEISGRSTNRAIIFGLIAWGNGGLDAALQDAKANAGFEVKEVYDIKTDQKVFTILFGLYGSRTTIVKAKVAN